ncbi:MAG TPA: ABC transporter ATP-binding protein [Thermoanaerobaculia bacterium]|jgi:ABC-2 type transport system ATP-binding protein
MADPLPLLVESLTKSFGKRRALDGADLEVLPGEIFGLLGPNGAGKTTLVRSVVGRAAPEQGRIAVFGLAPEEAVRRGRVGWAPQELALYPLLTPHENLWTFGRYQGLSGAALEAAIEASLAWIGLSDRAKDRTDKLSGGMRRRLNMAAGTIHGPGLLLLDEPTVGVDPQSRERLYLMIGELKSRGVSVLYTTHYMEEAERLCDRIAIIDHGKIIASGTKEELVRSTLGGGQALTVDTVAPLPATLRDALAASGATVDGTRLQMAVADAPRQIRELLERLDREGISVRDLSLRGASLEQVFLHLTGRELRE